MSISFRDSNMGLVALKKKNDVILIIFFFIKCHINYVFFLKFIFVISINYHNYF
jgi:hypothetical protein